ncbi:ArsR/SmtB family transcription factor [Pseudactinotalea sp.]|uniref:ArsR/SmtB family transcription factor n=1 Tax=Pseudactinotalea sp. TaxID=1926260 RepID=UPI003B3A6E02
MADHQDQPEAPPSTPDYALEETLELADPKQYRALFEDTRKQIVSVLLERAATTSELAEVLGRPKGTVGHHLKVLEEAGLVRVVRTQRVRALEAKYYGRTARVFLYRREYEAVGEEERLFAHAAAEIAQNPEGIVSANSRYARIPQERAEEWRNRLDELLLEFGAQSAEGDTTFAFVYGVYATTRPALPRDEA